MRVLVTTHETELNVKNKLYSSFHSVLSVITYYYVEFSFVLYNVVNDVSESAARFSRCLPDVWVGHCVSIRRVFE